MLRRALTLSMYILSDVLRLCLCRSCPHWRISVFYAYFYAYACVASEDRALDVSNVCHVNIVLFIKAHFADDPAKKY